MFKGENGKVKALDGVPRRMEEGSASGQMKMQEVPGSEFELPADLVLLAMGFVSPVHKGCWTSSASRTIARGNAKATTDGPGCYQTSLPKVFAAGDMRRGQSLVVWAIREGRQCARAVDEFLMGSLGAAALSYGLARKRRGARRAGVREGMLAGSRLAEADGSRDILCECPLRLCALSFSLLARVTRPKNDTLLRALLREPTPYTPVWIMRQAGRYLPEYNQTRARAGNFLALCKNPDLATEVTLQPLARFPLDAAILFSDILTIPDAMGLGLYFAEGEGPRFERPLREEWEVRDLTVPDP